ERTRVNEHLTCSVPYCADTRHGASTYCPRHRKANRMYGHPLGRRILTRDYAPEARKIAALLKAHPDHPGTARALAWVEAWLARAKAGDTTTPGFAQVARITAHGVTALQVLHACAAVWAYAQRNPRALPDDERLTFALASAVFLLAPRPLTRKYTYGEGC